MMHYTESTLKRLTNLSCLTLTVCSTLMIPALTQAAIPAGNVGGTAYFSYDQAAWSTMRASSYRTDVHGEVINDGREDPTSDTYGNRYFYPQLFEDDSVSPIKQSNYDANDDRIADGTADPLAVKQWRILDPAQMVPAVQPAGGFAMQVDPLETIGAFRSNGFIGSQLYGGGDSNPQNLFISLGGSLRTHSDFIAPGGTLWFPNLNLEQTQKYDADGNPVDVWYIGSRGYGPAKGTIFELINPKFGVDANGEMSLEADYKWGDSMWSSFLGFAPINDYVNPDGQKVLGHFSMNPSVVPVPGAVWLFGSALAGLVSIKRRKAVV